jgi:Leucine-rich repeat (LRR) protein
MQIFGLLSILITIALAAWWFGASGTVSLTQNEDGSIQESTYQEAINEANNLVGVNEKRNNPPASGPQIEVYDGISFPQNTTNLDLSGRGLSGALKAEVRQLSDLEVLDLSENNFTGLPAEVGQLSKLKVLNLSSNPFTGLPSELGNLKNLETLDLRGTQYSKQDLETIWANLSPDVNILVE